MLARLEILIKKFSFKVPVSAAGAVPPYYSEYDYSNYEPQSAAFSSSSDSSASLTDRQASIEAVLGAPVVITAFAAALFGGILSPLISEGLSRMADYQIEWPSIGAKETRRRRKKVSSSKARDLANNISWLDVLEGVNSVVSAISKVGGLKFALKSTSVGTFIRVAERFTFLTRQLLQRSAPETESFSAEDVSF